MKRLLTIFVFLQLWHNMQQIGFLPSLTENFSNVKEATRLALQSLFEEKVCNESFHTAFHDAHVLRL